MLVPEAELEQQVIRYIADIKDRYQREWRNPTALAHALGIALRIGSLGQHFEGLAVDNLALVGRVGTSQRQFFTAYHELTHQLIRRNDMLLSTLHEQYPSEISFERIKERLCNVGAAEFLIPRSMVVRECQIHGYSVAVIKSLSTNSNVSASAACVQLALCAPHRCIAIVARRKDVIAAAQTQLVSTPAARLVVDLAICSKTMRYRPAKDTLVPPGHLIHVALAGPEGEVMLSDAQIPFRQGKLWVTQCEAIRLGAQVFALFHIDPQPQRNSNQIPLDLNTH